MAMQSDHYLDEEDRYPELEGGDYEVGVDDPTAWDADAMYEAIYDVPSELQVPIEQACGPDGALLPMQLRESRLMRFGLETAVATQHCILALPDEHRDFIVRVICWAVRSERGRRTGNPVLRWKKVEDPHDAGRTAGVARGRSGDRG